MGSRFKARLLLLALPALLAGCAPMPGIPDREAEGKLAVVATLFPYYDFARQIAGEQVDLALVVPAGMDSHSFEPTPADIRTIQAADVLLCNGGAMEHWLWEVLDAVDTSETAVVAMMDYVDVVEEEMVEGMEGGVGGHVHEEGDGRHHGDGEDGEYDEHVWTSPANAMKMAEAVRDVLAREDPGHRQEYEAATEAYLAELERIDAGFRQVCRERKRDTIILGDKFPFRYLADQYGLDYWAAFSGCSTDTEPSAKTIAFLIDKVRQEGIPVVYYLELSSPRVAEVIGEETGAKPLLLHSCHNVTRLQFNQGATYVGLMEQNIENLRKGLVE